VLEACEPRFAIPIPSQSNANVHAMQVFTPGSLFAYNDVRLKLPTWGYQVRKILDGGRKMWSGTLEQDRQRRSTSD